MATQSFYCKSACMVQKCVCLFRWVFFCFLFFCFFLVPPLFYVQWMFQCFYTSCKIHAVRSKNRCWPTSKQRPLPCDWSYCCLTLRSSGSSLKHHQLRQCQSQRLSLRCLVVGVWVVWCRLHPRPFTYLGAMARQIQKCRAARSKLTTGASVPEIGPDWPPRLVHVARFIRRVAHILDVLVTKARRSKTSLSDRSKPLKKNLLPQVW